MIFFDFDGTVVNVWPRYYQVFLAASGFTEISQRDYVKAKRTLLSDQKVAQYFGKELPVQYFSMKRVLLEHEKYLCLDTLLASLTELNDIFSNVECRFLTKRRLASAFFAELRGLGLGHLSNKAIVLNPDEGMSKKTYLMQNFSQFEHIVIGDSESEWEAATLKNVHAVLVRTGLRRPEDFPLLERHTVVPSVSAFITSYMRSEMCL